MNRDVAELEKLYRLRDPRTPEDAPPLHGDRSPALDEWIPWRTLEQQAGEIVDLRGKLKFWRGLASALLAWMLIFLWRMR